jgi:DNA-binding IclR family transcriptional regulator
LSRELGIGKSTVHGITQALEQVGAVVRDEDTKCYSLGLTLFELAQRVRERIELKDIARPVMEDLMRQTQQTVFLGIRSNDRISIVDAVESIQDLKISAPVGARLPLLVGALGKVFLAATSEAEASHLIRSGALRKDTKKSITEPDRYWKEVLETRKTGYALDDEEYIQGVRAVAAPINVAGRPQSAIWVVGFTQSVSNEKLTAIARQTKRAADLIARKADLREMEGKAR